jgi:hypothetical protein
MSKRQYEKLGRDYSRQWGVTTVALRLGSFVPTSFERYGFGLLCGGVDDRDVSQAVLRALEATPAGGFDCFNIMAMSRLHRRAGLACGCRERAGALLSRRWGARRSA